MKLFNILFILILNNQCNDAIKYVKTPPFYINEAFYTVWVSGVKGGGSSINITIKYDENKSDDNFSFKGLYFKDTYVLLSKKTDIKTYTGNLKNTINNEGIESEMPIKKKEKRRDALPTPIKTSLKPNEAVLHYTYNNKDKYYKLALKEKRLSALPM